MIKSKPTRLLKQQSIQLAGLVLWRFGLLLAGVTAFFRTTRFVLRFVDLPTQLEVGVGLLITGFALVLGSLIGERIMDARSEGDLGS